MRPLGDDPEERGECFEAGPMAHTGPLVVRNPTLRWLPSQNGLLAEAPHRHSDRIRDKTGCRRRVDLTRLALTMDLV